jgi:hypothetical protein
MNILSIAATLTAAVKKIFCTVYYPILVSLVKSDNTHGLIIPDILLGMDESSL